MCPWQCRMHLVFECASLEHVRAKFCHLFSEQICTVKQFVWQPDTVQVMLFLREAYEQLIA